MKHIRTIIYALSFFAAAIPLLLSLQSIPLAQWYGFCTFVTLYLSLLSSPLRSMFPSSPTMQLFHRARKALGISAFFFALLHWIYAFFFVIGGFGGLRLLSMNHLVAITLSFVALIILTVLAITSLRSLVAKLGKKRWKFIHRFVYLAALLVFIDMVMIGNQFSDFSNTTSLLTRLSLVMLFILQALRIYRLKRERL